MIATKVEEDITNYERKIGKKIGFPIYPDEIASVLWEINTEYPDHVYDESGNDVFGRFDSAKKIIQVSTFMRINDGQVSFTTAHEVGHASMHDFMSSISCGNQDTKRSIKKIEQQAEKYASIILMPRNLTHEAVSMLVGRGLPVDFEVVSPKLMSLLKVSRQALEIRLGNLGYQLMNSRYGVSYERSHEKLFLEIEEERQSKRMV